MKWKSTKNAPPDGDRLYVLATDELDPDTPSISAQYNKERNEFYNLHGSLYLPLECSHWCEMPTFNEFEK